MTPNINKIIRTLTLIFLLFLNTSCKSEGENNKNEVLTKTTEKIQPKDSSDNTELEESDEGIDGDIYEFYNCYYFRQNDNDIPNINESQVYEHYKNSKIKIGKEKISINNKTYKYTVETTEALKLFRHKYEAEAFIKSFKYAFDTDLTKKSVEYYWIDPGESLGIELQDIVYEGYKIIKYKDLIFLKKYEGYMICYKKRDKSISKNLETCKLPFYTGRAKQYCNENRDDMYKFLCEEYPIHIIEKDKKLKTELEKYIPNKNLQYYYKLETGINDIKTLVVVTEHQEESTGDLFLITLKNDKVVSLLEDTSKIFLDSDSNNFFHSFNFEVLPDLSIIIYEDNQMKPKNKIISRYKINTNGTFSKVK